MCNIVYGSFLGFSLGLLFIGYGKESLPLLSTGLLFGVMSILGLYFEARKIK